MISIKEIEKEIKVTKNLIQQEQDTVIKLVSEIYDLFEYMLEHSHLIYINQIEPPPHDLNRNSMCFAALHKGLLGLYNAIDCVAHGRVGLAALSLRPVVEFLILAKAAVHDESGNILCDWIEQKEINFQRRIYNYIKLNRDDVEGFEQMKDFYKVLGKFVHSTRVSQQVSFSYDMVKEEVAGIFPLILVLFHMYRHLLFSIYAPNLDSALTERAEGYAEKVKRLNILLDGDGTLKMLPVASRRVVAFYRKKWVLELPPLAESRQQSLFEYERMLEQVSLEHIKERIDEVNRSLGHNPIDKTKKHRAIKNPKPLEKGEYDAVIEIDGELWYYDDDDFWFDKYDKTMFRKDMWGNFAEKYIDEDTGKKCRRIEYAVLIDGFDMRGKLYEICEPLDHINDMIAEGIYKLIRRGG